MDLFTVLFPTTAAQLDRIEESQQSLHTKVDTLMGQVRVNQEDLDALDTSLDEIATNLATHIAGLDLPEGDLSALRDDVEALRALSAPPVEEPEGEGDLPPQ